MCTLVFNLAPGTPAPLRILAIRDELSTRAFDLPDAHWPRHPDAVGGRDRQAGGTWCASDVATGATAAVLNRPERRDAEPGAPSRGELPLLLLEHGAAWQSHIDITGMAGFNLVLLTPDSATLWWYSGDQVRRRDFAPGTHMVTPLGADPATADPRRDRWAQRLIDAVPSADAYSDAPAEQVWSGWLALIRDQRPADDPSAIIVRHPLPDGQVYASVFGQLIASRPGRLRVDYSTEPTSTRPWATLRRTAGARP
jgi:uncharacterized protein with NRDE domain